MPCARDVAHESSRRAGRTLPRVHGIAGRGRRGRRPPRDASAGESLDPRPLAGAPTYVDKVVIVTGRLRLLPPFDIARNDAEQRVGEQVGDRVEPGGPLRIASAELRLKMQPLVLKLTASDGDRSGRSGGADAVLIEAVASGARLGVHGPKVLRDGGGRNGMAAKAVELRVVAIAARGAP